MFSQEGFDKNLIQKNKKNILTQWIEYGFLVEKENQLWLTEQGVVFSIQVISSLFYGKFIFLIPKPFLIQNIFLSNYPIMQIQQEPWTSFEFHMRTTMDKDMLIYSIKKKIKIRYKQIK